MSFVSLPFGLIQEDKHIKLNLPKNYAASQYIKCLPYVKNEDTHFQNKIIDLVNNRTDLNKKSIDYQTTKNHSRTSV